MAIEGDPDPFENGAVFGDEAFLRAVVAFSEVFWWLRISRTGRGESRHVPRID